MVKRFARDIHSLEEVFAFLQCFHEDEQVGASDAFAINLAVEEIFTNMLKYESGVTTDIDIALECNGESATVVLTSFGSPPFDVTSVARPNIDAPVSERRPGGLGLHLIRQMVDRLEYAHRDGNSIVTIVKHLETRHV